MMKIMLFCPDRHGPRDVLHVLAKTNVEVVGCVCDEQQPSLMGELCKELKIPMITTRALYENLEAETLPSFDLGISYLYPRLLRESIIEYPSQGIINFHPAPVSVHKGVAACCYALLENYDKWAVTAHYAAAKFDEGDVIEERWFDLPRGGGYSLTALDIERIAQEQSLMLFQELLTKLLAGETLPRCRQDLTKGHYFSRKELDSFKDISKLNSTEEIDRRVHALWFPPYHGASIMIGGKRYTIVDDELLKQLGKLYGC